MRGVAKPLPPKPPTYFCFFSAGLRICRASSLLAAILGSNIREGKKTNLEGTQQALVDTHHGTGIVEFSTVVRCAEQSNQLTLRKEFVTILNNLVSSADEIHIVLLQESRNNVRPKSE